MQILSAIVIRFLKKKSVDIIFNLISQLHISCFKDQREISIKDKIFLKERARFHFEKCSPFLSFLPMKRKIKINRNRSILYTKYFLSFFLSSREYLLSLIPIVEIDSKLLTNGQKSPRGTLHEGGWTNLGTRILCVRFANPSWRSRVSSHRSDKKRAKWRNKFRSGPKWETRVPLLGHYRPEYSLLSSPPSFNNARCNSLPSIQFSPFRFNSQNFSFLSSFFFYFQKKEYIINIFSRSAIQLVILPPCWFKKLKKSIYINPFIFFEEKFFTKSSFL